MNIDHIEYANAFVESRGVLIPGRLVFSVQGVGFKNQKTGKAIQIPPAEWAKVLWLRIAGGFGLKFVLTNGQMHRFAGFKESDLEKISTFIKKNYPEHQLKEEDKSVKGFNWGAIKYNESFITFAVDKQVGFDIPLSYVSQCNTSKNEAIVEFHPNDEAAVSLMEMRFYIPGTESGEDPVQKFADKVLAKADIIQTTGEHILSLTEVPSLTPRGRYELKVYPTFLQLHGKTFDYKIPYNSILRIFILPHPDGRQMYFVLSLDPPIKQGQTRYPFLILNFKKDEDVIEVELELTENELKQKYDGRLEKRLSGQTYEVLGRVMKGLINRKITVPGGFKGALGASALSCSYKAAAGFLYPLDRGFIYVHKPAIHVRFDEVSAVNFARSGGNTRSFDFEIETKNGIVHTFNSIQKEEYSRLFDFVTGKGLRVKNRGDKEEGSNRKKLDEILDSDEETEHDAYLEKVKKEGKERDEDDEEEDEDFKPPSEGSDVAEEFDSDASGSSGEDEGGEGSSRKKHKEKRKEKKSHKRSDDEEEDEEEDDEEQPEKSKPSKPKKPRKTKEAKDPDMPKRSLSAYMLWLNENREKIKSDTPGISQVDILKKAGELWKSVESGDRKKWEKMADEKKEEYNEKMKIYKQNQKNRDEVDDAKSTKKEKPQKKAKKEDGKKKSTASTSKGSPTKSQFKSAEFVVEEDSSSSDKSD